MSSEPLLVSRPSDLADLLRAVEGVRRLAIDAEGNGLFAYRTRLCTLQLGWEAGDEVSVAIIDTLQLDPAALAGLLGPDGPIKLLHDCTFDVKLLSEAKVTLERVRDTSVLARMLGRKATGLASLLAGELGIKLDKELQQHDWSRRPLEPRQVAYLADDVRHLMSLDDKLAGEARALDIEEEVETECAFKVRGALLPPREKKPAYLRVRGNEKLDKIGLSVLRRLVEERERFAAEWDQPPFKVASNDWLLSVAHAKPADVGELRRVRGGFAPRLQGGLARLVAAVQAGLADGELPPEPSAEARLDRRALAAQRAREKRLTAWRRKEAAARGVDEQVVLPGHCLQDLAALEVPDFAAIASVPGLGEKRLARYGEIMAALMVEESESPPPTPSEP
jgi:ribonuclease D